MPDIAIQLLITFASMAYQQSQYQKMKRRQEAEADKRKGHQITTSGTTAPIPVVYGKQSLGGINTDYKIRSNYDNYTDNSDKVFEANLGANHQTGTKNEYLGVQSILCHGGIEGVQHVLVNDMDYRGLSKEMVDNETKFNHRFFTFNDGGTQCNAGLQLGFPSTHTWDGLAHVTSIYKLDRDNPQYSGIPMTQFFVKGRKIRKITKSGNNYTLNSTYQYSNNPAYCLLDYLLNADFGRGLSTNEVDLKSFYNSAQVCETVVMSNALIAGQVNGVKPIFGYTSQADFPQVDVEPYQTDFLYHAQDTDTLYSMTQSNGTPTYTPATAPGFDDIRLYDCNITLDTSATIRENIQLILDTMGMAEFVWTPEGKYKLILDYPRSQNEMDNLIVREFNEDNVIRTNVNITWPKATDRFNQVTVNFINEHEEFKEDTVTWPRSYSPVHDIYMAADNNQPMTTSLSADGVTDPYHAKALAEQMVRKSRSIYTISFTVNKDGLVVEPGDLVKLNLPSMSINNEIFRIESIEVMNDFTVKLTGYYFDYNVLAWNIADDEPYHIRPVLNFKIEAPSVLQFTVDDSDILGTASGKLSWFDVDDASVRGYIVEISYDDATWKEIGRTSSNTFDVFGLKTGVYAFSVRSYNITGAVSERTIISGQTVQLKTAEKILVVYADSDDETTNNQSLTLNANEYVAYYVFDGDEPTLPIRSGIEFSKFIGQSGEDAVSVVRLQVFKRSSTTPLDPAGGAYDFDTQSFSPLPIGWSDTIPAGEDPIYTSFATASIFGNSGQDTSLNWSSASLLVQNGDDGADGADGANGSRGAGWWRYETGTSAATTGLSNSTLNVFFASATGLPPVAGDRLIVVNTSKSASAYLRNNANNAWLAQAAFIDGSLLVNGTVTASAINVGNLSDIDPNAGTITAGVLRNSNSTFVIDLNNGSITISV